MPKSDVSLKRSVAVQLYLKEGIADEDLLLRVWHMAQRKSRGQNLFRMMLTAGLLSLTENGQMPEDIVEALNLDMLVDKKIRRKRRIEEARNPQTAPPAHPPAGFGYPPPYPPQFMPQPFPVPSYYPPMADQYQPPQQQAVEPSRSLDVSHQKQGEPHQEAARPIEGGALKLDAFPAESADQVAADETPIDNGNGDAKGASKKSFLNLM